MLEFGGELLAGGEAESSTPFGSLPKRLSQRFERSEAMLTRCESMFGRKLAAGAHQIGPSRRALGQGGYSRSYLFEDKNGRLTLVDTGWDKGARTILRYLDDIGRSPQEIEYIALTHSHRSHLGGLARLVQLSGAKVRCHADEAAVIEGRRRSHPIRLWPPFPVRLYLFRIISHLPIMKHVPCEVDKDHPLGEHCDEHCRVGPLTVLHTPGHTPGHLAFSYGNTLVVGDSVATWPWFMPGWPGFNLNEAQYRQSLKRLVGLSPEIVCPGHGDAIVENTAERLRGLV
jgi:glyoxylase-like metal-dependent hydrolase (beta-lactamase superfamily II)